eukprot:GEMP01052326.1.p1 GENE.GEMP01052326.1~~GEMP01052326.1.p1  ORF type:complete len:329 (+),score=62.89 GEMP01052326.1:231-1217(+)
MVDVYVSCLIRRRRNFSLLPQRLPRLPSGGGKFQHNSSGTRSFFSNPATSQTRATMPPSQSGSSVAISPQSMPRKVPSTNSRAGFPRLEDLRSPAPWNMVLPTSAHPNSDESDDDSLCIWHDSIEHGMQSSEEDWSAESDAEDIRRKNGLPYIVIAERMKAPNAVKLRAVSKSFVKRKRHELGSLSGVVAQKQGETHELKHLEVKIKFRGQKVGQELCAQFMATCYPEPFVLYFDPGDKQLAMGMKGPSSEMVLAAAIVYLKSAVKCHYTSLTIYDPGLGNWQTATENCGSYEIYTLDECLRLSKRYAEAWRRKQMVFQTTSSDDSQI